MPVNPGTGPTFPVGPFVDFFTRSRGAARDFPNQEFVPTKSGRRRNPFYQGGATGPTNPRVPTGPAAPPRGQNIDTAQPYTPPSARGPSPADIPLPGGAQYVPPPWSSDRFEWFEGTDSELEELYRDLPDDPASRDYVREEVLRRLELEKAERELAAATTVATRRELRVLVDELKRDIAKARRAEILKRDLEKIGRAREVMRQGQGRAFEAVGRAGRILTGPLGYILAGVLWPQEMGPEKNIPRTRTRKRSGPAPEFTPPGSIGPPRRGGARRPQAPATARPGPTALPGGSRPAPRARVAPGPRTTQLPRPAPSSGPAPSRPVATAPRPAPRPVGTAPRPAPSLVERLLPFIAGQVVGAPRSSGRSRSELLGVSRVGGNRFRDPLTLTPLEDRAVPSGQPVPLPSPSGNCPPCDSKKRKRKKSQPRTECYSGTYTERARGLTKRKRRRVPCT